MEVPLTDASDAPPSNPTVNPTVYHDASLPNTNSVPAPPPQYPSDPISHAQPGPSNGPRRGSFPDVLPQGHTLPQPISASIGLVTQDMSSSMQSALPKPDLGHQDPQTDSDPDFQSSGARSSMSVAPRSLNEMPQETEDSTITVADFLDTQAGHISSTASTPSVTQSVASHRSKQYLLPNGSVVPGKGLGRGRPGLKRGPRTPKYPTGDAVSSPAASMIATVGSSESANPPSKKRKSGNSVGSLINAQVSTLDSVTTPSRESSENYNPTATQTRSGRHSHRPVSLTDATAASASPSRKGSRADRPTSTASASPATVKTHPKIKRRVYRGREQFALCEHCLRGHGPPVNVIVFCDACNKCWHQRCHDPPISKQTVSDTKTEWFCSECDRILHGTKKAKKMAKPSAQSTLTVPVTKPTLAYDGPLVGGRLLDAGQKSAYLSTLQKDDLVSLLLEASNLAPDLPIFKRLVPVSQPIDFPQAQFTSTYVTPASKPPMFADKDPRNTTDTVDEGYDDYFEDHSALYPKAGNGVQLPPESEDLHILLEGKDSKTFSHWVRGMGGQDFSGTGNVMS
ncbi:hypothetical protein A1O3_06851 [Capronia epimyces CBS 606.96]|uniref:PHD-type domain-containing protein n=1 Tax=Capronia epimyces CBS 606.96 TaxID=1182542 RepID=W9YL89_9EURO|nr:uncharacterized protein A1O3_06851 [Capronia epimyces CBS 606.96]EXJ83034.1 hypothetical protein A1O3_06851 [Capronia epimyces CBS 606.96]